MRSDHRKLKVFEMGHALVIDIYRITKRMPPEERYGLTSQIRRAAVSVPNNLVEGCARFSRREFARFVDIALGSASETRYLLQVAREVEALSPNETLQLEHRYDELVRALHSLAQSLEQSL